MTVGLETLSAGWGEITLRATWQGGLLIAAVWLVCRLLPRLPASWRCWLWWLTCLRLLVGLLDLPPLQVPLLAPPPAVRTVHAPTAEIELSTPSSMVPFLAPQATAPSPTLLLLGLWTIGVLVRMGAGARTFWRVRSLLREAQPVDDARIRDEATRLSEAAGLRRLPRTLLSASARAPMLVGPVAPALLLPAEAIEGYDSAELRMALAHELVHLRRGDLWLSLVPGLVQALFFFHPLAWLATREWAVSREAACDAETLRLTTAQPADYGRFLLKLSAAGPAPAGALSASPSYRTLERRLQMLRETASSHSRPPRSRRGVTTVVLLAIFLVVGFLPWQVTAKETAGPAVPPRAADASDGDPAAPSRVAERRPDTPKVDTGPAAGMEERKEARYQELLAKLEQERAARQKLLMREPIPRTQSERERLLKIWDTRDRRDTEIALHAFEQELKALLEQSVAKGADRRALELTHAHTRQMVRKLMMRSVASEQKNRRVLLESLSRSEPAAFDPSTSMLTIPKGAAAITGRIPVPTRPAPVADSLQNVEVRGNTVVSSEALLKVLKTRTGEPFDRQSWDADCLAISRLYQDQGYQVTLGSEGPKDGRIVITIRELRVGEVKFKWLTPPSEKQEKAAHEVLGLKRDDLYNTKSLQKDFAALMALGLFDKINPLVEVNQALNVVVVWEVSAAK